MGKKEQDAALLKQVAAGDMGACRILVDEHNDIVTQAALISRVVYIMGETLRLPIDPVQPAAGADPDSAGPILANGPDKVVTQAVRVSGVSAVVPPAIFISIVAAQSGIGAPQSETTRRPAFDSPTVGPRYG